MKKAIFTLSVVLIVGLIFSTCATPPTEEMNKAQDAVTRAESDADAVTYAGNTLLRARETLDKMMTEVNGKRYDAAKTLASEAIDLAEKAIADGKAGAERARNEAANLLNSLQAPLAEAATNLNAAREAGDLELDLDALSDDMDIARRTYDDARQSFQANDFQDTTAKCQRVRSLLADISYRINNAAQAVSRKK